MFLIKCNNCDWKGEEEELELLAEPLNDVTGSKSYYKGCPTCKTDSFLIDVIEQNTCAICDKPIANNKTFCSKECAKIDLKDTRDDL